MAMVLGAKIWRDKVVRTESSFHVIEPISSEVIIIVNRSTNIDRKRTLIPM
jgi:hypothetical protein